MVQESGRKQFTRAEVLQAGAGGLAAAALAACGSLGPAVSDIASNAKPAAPVEIEYWHTLNATTNAEAQGRTAALKISEQTNAQYFKIRFEQEGGSNMDKIIAGVSAGTPPNFLVLGPNNGAQLFDLGATIALESDLKTLPAWSKVRASFARPTYLDGATWRGKQVCLPLYRVFQAMMYAPEPLQKAGISAPPPTWTWPDFETIAKRASRPPDLWGLDVAWTYSGWQNWVGSNGVRFVNKEQTKVSFAQPAAIEALEFLSRLTFGLQLVPPESLGELLIKGQTVFEQQGAYRGRTLRQAGVRFEPIDMPRGPQALKAAPLKQGTMYSFMVFKATDPAKQRAAVRAALGCLTDEAQAELCRISLSLPVSQSALESKAYGQFLAQDREMKLFAEMSPSVDIRPSFPSVDMMFTIVGDAMTRIYKRQDTITSALAEAERQTQLVLDADHAGKR